MKLFPIMQDYFPEVNMVQVTDYLIIRKVKVVVELILAYK